LIVPDTGRVAAVLDWELCTIGDPLADLGFVMVHWNDGVEAPLRMNDPTPAGGFTPFADLVDRYAERTGFDVSDLNFYAALACWRLSIITQGVVSRLRAGAMGAHEFNLEEMTGRVIMLGEKALDFLNAV
jgi:aminoglycoside phosphotransferase (APT) family kinase protein